MQTEETIEKIKWAHLRRRGLTEEQIRYLQEHTDTKWCSHCKQIKNQIEFGTDRNRRDNKTTLCFTCTSKRSERYKDVSEIYKLKSRYGITQEELQELIVKFKNRCYICRRSFTEVPMHIDHDHRTNTVRGLLCENHNWAIGHFEDNIVWLKRAIRYILDDQALAKEVRVTKKAYKSKLTEEQVREIKLYFKDTFSGYGAVPHLSDKYKVSIATINNIKLGISWKEVQV